MLKGFNFSTRGFSMILDNALESSFTALFFQKTPVNSKNIYSP